jgi:hypothetical protein
VYWLGWLRVEGFSVGVKPSFFTKRCKCKQNPYVMKKILRVIIISPDKDYTTQLVSKLVKTYRCIDVATIANEAELFPILFKDDMFTLVCLKKEKQIPEHLLQSYKVYENPKYNLRLFVFQDTYQELVQGLNTKTALFLKAQYPFLKEISSPSFFSPNNRLTGT